MKYLFVFGRNITRYYYYYFLFLSCMYSLL